MLVLCLLYRLRTVSVALSDIFVVRPRWYRVKFPCYFHAKILTETWTCVFRSNFSLCCSVTLTFDLIPQNTTHSVTLLFVIYYSLCMSLQLNSFQIWPSSTRDVNISILSSCTKDVVVVRMSDDSRRHRRKDVEHPELFWWYANNNVVLLFEPSNYAVMYLDSTVILFGYRDVGF